MFTCHIPIKFPCISNIFMHGSDSDLAHFLLTILIYVYSLKIYIILLCSISSCFILLHFCFICSSVKSNKVFVPLISLVIMLTQIFAKSLSYDTFKLYGALAAKLRCNTL